MRKMIATGAGIIMFSIAGSALAAANCNDQPKPAFGCPNGYEMMCVPAGGAHWACGKENAQRGKADLINSIERKFQTLSNAAKKKAHDAAMAAIQNIR